MRRGLLLKRKSLVIDVVTRVWISAFGARFGAAVVLIREAGSILGSRKTSPDYSYVHVILFEASVNLDISSSSLTALKSSRAQVTFCGLTDPWCQPKIGSTKKINL